MNFAGFLKFGVDQGASDLHLQAGSPPGLRINGQFRVVEAAPVDGDALREFIASLRPDAAGAGLDRLLARGRPFGHGVEGLARFRCALHRHQGQPGITMRVIPGRVPTPADLHLPPAIGDIALARRGLTLVVGPAGSGRTTTMAAMVGLVNQSSQARVVTIEAPIEFVHPREKAVVSQWEVGRDTPGFSRALRSAIRQDPDLIVIGDLAGSRLVRSVLRAAEAGHRILAAMPGNETVQTIERILAAVPSAEKAAATRQIATSLEAIVALRLATTKEGGRRPAVEVLRGGPLTMRSILDHRLNDLRRYLTGRQGGMQSLDQHLIDLHHAGLISGTEALRLSIEPETVATSLRASRPAGAA